ncbi:hypothetical protein [Roseospira navarrensis]|uniref:Uncharacterized protein n=1 Tax=Roseospira navarrensis TaxID=140058 RepID=A0A7X1ZEZ3_9PROT|nr:hypothetical protein [Roseospira navarrensis]MQX37068.1 hypothetical protein [Roseospira navarrensis]
MTRGTRHWLGLIAVGVVAGTALLAAWRTGVVSGDRLLVPKPETVRIELPERGGRLGLQVPEQGWLAPLRARRLWVERAGQRIIDTALFPAPLDRRFGLAVHWFPAEGRHGPYVRLADPAGDILLDLRGFAAWRMSALGETPWLVAPSGVAAAGVVRDGEGGMMATAGRPVPPMVLEDDGTLIGRVIEADDGLVFQPAAESEP